MTRAIREYDTVYINGKSAVVKEILDSSITAKPKAIIIQDGQTYSVGIGDLKLTIEDKN